MDSENTQKSNRSNSSQSGRNANGELRRSMNDEDISMPSDNVAAKHELATKYVDVRTMFADSTRNYYIAVFPDGPRGGGPYPDFGSQSFPAPVRLQVEDIVPDAADDLGDSGNDPNDSESGFRSFRKRRHYRARKEQRWVLSSKRKKKERTVLYGEAEGQKARYFVIIPPVDATEPFRIVPIHEWIKFTKPLTRIKNREEEAMAETKKKPAKLALILEQRKQARETESTPSLRASSDTILIGNEEIIEGGKSGEILDTDSKKQKPDESGMADVAYDEEEDLEVMAIDRKGSGRGEGNGDADFEEEFQDDENDASLMQEDGDAVADEDALIQGAEEVAEALSNSDDDSGGEDDEDEDETGENMEALLERQKAGTLDDADFERAGYLANQRSLQLRTKIVNERVDQERSTGKRSMSDMKVDERVPPMKKARTPQEVFKDSVCELARHNGGTMKAKELYKQAISSKNLKACDLTKDQAVELLRAILKDNFEVKEDNITGSRIAVLKT